MPAKPLHNTTLNGDIRYPQTVRAYIKLFESQHLTTAITFSTALSGSETVHSASFTAFKKNIADMVDLLKQMWFLLIIEMYTLWHKRIRGNP